MKTRAQTILIILITAMLLTACSLPNFHLGNVSFGEIRIAMIGSSLPGEMSYSFRTFKGYESRSFDAVEGETITLDYQAQVDKGSLTLILEDPNGDIAWQIPLEDGLDDRAEVKVSQTGKYRIAVSAENAGGSFTVQWEVE